jgi:hypothetical protein
VTQPAPSILDGVAATAVTRQIVGRAAAAGLRPHLGQPVIYCGAYRVLVNAEGVDGLFGAVYVGARTGRILRAYLTHGNHGQEKRYDKVAAVRTVIQSWAALQRGATR